MKNFPGKSFDEKVFLEYLKGKEEPQQNGVKDRSLNIGILGARANENIGKILEQRGANVAFGPDLYRGGQKAVLG